jgi:hypothetical protein
MDIDRVIEGVRLQTRLASALGAAEVPGEAVLAELERVADSRTGPLRLLTGARLDRLGWGLPVDPLVLLQGAEHLPLDHALLYRLIDELRPQHVLLRVSADEQGLVTASVELPCAELPDSARALLGEALALVPLQVQSLRVGADALAVGLPCPGPALLVQLCRQVASEAQSRWQGAMREALPAGGARLLLEVSRERLQRVVASYEGVSMETVLRTLLHLHPQERAPRVLGALAAAADTEQATLSLVSHPAEPPLVEIELR